MNSRPRASVRTKLAFLSVLVPAVSIAGLAGGLYFLAPFLMRLDSQVQIGLASAAVALALALQFLSTRLAYNWYIARPLRRLNGALEKVAGGDSSLRVDVVEAPEFSALAESVNVALDSVLEIALTADLDEFTGVNSCRRLHEYLKVQIDLARRYDRCLTLAVFSIDKMTDINDFFGHAAGDAVIYDAAQYIRTSLREVDFVARCGGKEFVAVMPETSPAPAMAVIARLQNAFPARVAVGKDGEKTPVRLSAGVADFPLSGEDPNNLLAAATMALHLAKRRGRNQAVYFRALEDAAA